MATFYLPLRLYLKILVAALYPTIGTDPSVPSRYPATT